MDIVAYNRGAWDFQVARGNPWTLPVSREAIAAAVRDEWSVVLTPQRPVPRSWFPPLKGAKTLCLAGAGGQQAGGSRLGGFHDPEIDVVAIPLRRAEGHEGAMTGPQRGRVP